jgi:Fe-S cluster assembly protein SufD
METTIVSPAKEKWMRTLVNHEFTNGKAAAALEQFDFPTTRDEDWKYTRVARIANEEWKVASDGATIDTKAFEIEGLDAYTLVFVDGKFSSGSSRMPAEQGIHVSQETILTSERETYEHFFQAMADAASTDIINVLVEKNTIATKAIHIIHVSTQAQSLAQPHIRLIAMSGANIHCVESFVCTSEIKAFTNRTLKITVEENAHVHWDKIQLESDANFLMNEDNVHIASNGNFTINTLTIDGGWVRNALNITLDGQNIEANLNGFYMPRRKQFVDNHTRVDHRKPHCNSNELYKGVLNDQSTGVFNGKVYVQIDAQKTNAFQSCANILLSDDATMNTKPELEIYADDVKCSHGTTTGQLDEEALFYLKSRGLGEDNARRLLTSAFIGDVISKIDNDAVREYVIDQLTQRELLFA